MKNEKLNVGANQDISARGGKAAQRESLCP